MVIYHSFIFVTKITPDISILMTGLLDVVFGLLELKLRQVMLLI